MRDAECRGIVRLPGIVTEQAEEDPCRAQQNQPGLLQGAVPPRWRQLGRAYGSGDGIGKRHGEAEARVSRQNTSGLSFAAPPFAR